jgi:hypothetical protein
MYIYLYVCIHIYIYKCISIFIYVYIYKCICRYIYIYYIYIHITYINKYIYTYMHTFIYIYVYTYQQAPEDLSLRIVFRQCFYSIVQCPSLLISYSLSIGLVPTATPPPFPQYGCRLLKPCVHEMRESRDFPFNLQKRNVFSHFT